MLFLRSFRQIVGKLIDCIGSSFLLDSPNTFLTVLSMKMFHTVNSGFLSLILIVVILVITISNRLSFSEIGKLLKIWNFFILNFS